MAGSLTISTLKDSSGVLATQNGMTGIAKAWVNFAGATATVNGSFNVSSVTRSSTGIYTINLTTALPNANVSVFICTSTSNVYGAVNGTITTTAVPITTVTGTGALAFDATLAFVSVFSS